MGNYSYFVIQDNMKVRQDISFLEFRKLKEILGALIDGEGNINFEEWSGHKIQGYWYDETKQQLALLAKFLDYKEQSTLTVTFDFEHEYLFQIVFKDHKAFFRTETKQDPVWEECEALP